MPKILAFTGLDGSGKTKHTVAIHDWLKKKGLKVVSTHQFALAIPLFQRLKLPFYPFIEKVHLSLARFGTVECQSSHLEDTNKNRASTLMPFAVIYMVIAGLLRTWLKILLNLNCDVIIFDRYYIDELVRLEWKFGVNLSKLIWICLLVPRPDCLLFLDLSPAVAWKRTNCSKIAKKLFWEKSKYYAGWIDRLKTCWNIRHIHTDVNTFKQTHRSIRRNLAFIDRRTHS